MTTKRTRNPRICAGPKHDRLLPMGELQNRPCEVDGRPALFHRWIEEDRALLRHNFSVIESEDRRYYAERYFFEKNVCLPGCSFDIITETFALVEYQNGTVAKVKPEQVRFVNKEG